MKLKIRSKKKNNFGVTVGELKKQLEEYDDDALIVMSSDGEGNNYSPFISIEDEGKMVYVCEKGAVYSGDIYSTEMTPYLEKIGYEMGEDVIPIKDLQRDDNIVTPCIIMYPIN